jgi:hypothetical protein
MVTYDDSNMVEMRQSSICAYCLPDGERLVDNDFVSRMCDVKQASSGENIILYRSIRNVYDSCTSHQVSL